MRFRPDARPDQLPPPERWIHTVFNGTAHCVSPTAPSGISDFKCFIVRGGRNCEWNRDLLVRTQLKIIDAVSCHDTHTHRPYPIHGHVAPEARGALPRRFAGAPPFFEYSIARAPLYSALAIAATQSGCRQSGVCRSWGETK